MQVLLTFDYELFFGENTGSVEKCMIEPTRKLLALCKKYNSRMTFFIDVGYLLKLEEYAPDFPVLKGELSKIKKQISEMLASHCSVQLHIHPHWEKSHWDGNKWQIVTDGAYKLSDFPDEEIDRIVRKYHAYLADITKQPVNCFRAGGWCIQPFAKVEKVFSELGIKIDSSVFPGGKFESEHYQFDFTSVKRYADNYHFQDDVCTPVTEGEFLEVPIASWYYKPSFYWKLYLMGRMDPKNHKMIGDGSFLAQPGRKKSVLTSPTWNHVSSDGYYAGMLAKQAVTYETMDKKHFTVIGHPKGLTLFALKKLEEFIRDNRNNYKFSSFSDL